MNARIVSVVVGLLVSLSWTQAFADPLPGEIVKFSQRPMIATPIAGVTYFGHDERSTAIVDPADPNVFRGEFMADDFADRVTSDVVHVRWWGSYINAATDASKVRQFAISFESDAPADATVPFSRPREPLLSQVVDRVAAGPLVAGSGTYTETLIRGPDPLLSESLYEYNAELQCPFPQKADTVYWLKIAALVDPTIDGTLNWGWHNRDYTIMDPFASAAVVPGETNEGPLPPAGTDVWHFQDDAVQGAVSLTVNGNCDVTLNQQTIGPTTYLPPFDGPTTIISHSKDLAFELYRVPEPSSVVLLVLGGVAFLGVAWKRRCAR